MKKCDAGFTLVEITIAIAILTIIMGSAVTTMRSGQQTFRRSMSNMTVDAKANRAISRIARRLQGAGRLTISVDEVAPESANSISFQEIVGWTGGVTEWSADVEIRFEYDPTEIDNGLDDDGDGFADEGRVILIENIGEPEERRVVLATSVREFLAGETPNLLDDNDNGLEDERGLAFELRGDALVIHLTVMRRDPEGGVSMRTLQTSVGLRN